MPAIRFRDGVELSTDARRGLLAALAADDASVPFGGLAAVRREIDDGDAAELLAAMQREMLGHKPWRVLAIGTLGSDAQLDALGAGARTPLEIEALCRSGRGIAFEWLDHLAEHGEPALARVAGEALRRACEERGVDRDRLFDHTTPHAPHDPEKTRATLRRRLEAAMIEIDEAALVALRRQLAALALVQPFAQLERPFTRDAEAQLSALIAATEPRPLVAFEGLLRQRGYHRGEVEHGVVTDSRRPLADGWVLMARHDAIWVRERGQKKCGLQGIEPVRLPIWAPPTPALFSEAFEDARVVLEGGVGAKKARAPKPRKPRTPPAT
ncbi:hypothetical protein [Polyangium sp. 15x6]|uniref:hypothetical protein n=1 Tax=Polyangium sp. 15x6 TaxID=3042687 RepID=UPI00249BB49A|nr:hypothetical protein [Polyangium sp. 15x6]MDI3289271.1 hypothetical protein [Polyangium sp. 15x6]